MLKRMALLLVAVLLVSLGQVSPTLAQSTVLYACNGGGSGGGGTNNGAMLTINQTNGAATLVGTPAGYTALTGCDFNSQGRLFATTSDGSTGHLLELNPTTGAIIADIGLLQTAGSDSGAIGDLSFQPGTDVLFAITSNAGNKFGLSGSCGTNCGGYLVTINTSTAIVTIISPATITGDNDNGALAFAPDGTLYFAPMWNTNNRILIVNPATGVATNGPAGVALAENFMGLEFNPVTGELWGSSYDTAGDIYKINPTTGAITPVGTNANQYVHDLAFYLKPAAAVGGVAEMIAMPTASTNGLGYLVGMASVVMLVGAGWLVSKR